MSDWSVAVDIDSARDQLLVFSQRLQAMRHAAHGPSAVRSASPKDDGEEGSDDPFAEAIEELQVVNEELRAQQQELFAAREQVEDEHRRYQQLFEFAPDAYLVTDRHGLIVEANRAAAEMFQIEQGFLTGKPLVVFLPEADKARLRTLLAQLQQTDRVPEWEAQVRPRRGTAFPAALTVSVERDGTGRAVSFRWLLRNISERKWAEEALANEAALRDYSRRLEDLVADRTAQIQQLERARAQAEKMAAIGRIAARMAHEVNNPLAGVKSAFALVKTAVPPDHRYAPYAARIDAEIDRIAGIVRQMFNLYRPGREDAHPFLVERTLHDVAAMMEPACRERGVTVEVEAPASAMVDGVLEGSVRQILYNLLQNAVDASPMGAPVRLAAGVDPASLTLLVADEGEGIPEELRERIFEPFFTTKSDLPRSGLGLGLSITRSLVEAAEGSIRLDSEVGRGTTVRVVLPRGHRKGVSLPDETGPV